MCESVAALTTYASLVKARPIVLMVSKTEYGGDRLDEVAYLRCFWTLKTLQGANPGACNLPRSKPIAHF